MTFRELLHEYIAQLEHRLRWGVWARGLAIVTGGALVATLVLVVIANALAFSQGIVTTARFALILLLAVAAAAGLVLPLRRLTRRRAVAAAETAFPQFEQRLSTFTERDGRDPFIELLAGDTLEVTRLAEPEQLVTDRRLVTSLGTSAGALTGIVYATGLDGDYCAHRFSADLTPSWLFRHLPQGNHWYLLHQYRRGKFDPMLRKYLHDWRIEQLVLPCMSVTVDLVSGKTVIRDRGDAIHAILESINIPVFSPPICRSGQALIDGGLVNNIPADVLVAMGCNFVIASSVSAKMETEFSDITPESSVLPRKRPSILPTLLRSLQVQNYSLNALGVQPADAMIQPDVTGFDLTEFMRAKELAAVGEAAAKDQLPKIQQLLTRLDPQLFRQSRTVG